MAHMLRKKNDDESKGIEILKDLSISMPAANFDLFLIMSTKRDWHAAFEYFKKYNPRVERSTMPGGDRTLAKSYFGIGNLFKIERYYFHLKSCDMYGECKLCIFPRPGPLCPHKTLDESDIRFLNAIQERYEECPICYEKNKIVGLTIEALLSDKMKCINFIRCPRCRKTWCLSCSRHINRCPFCRGNL